MIARIKPPVPVPDSVIVELRNDEAYKLHAQLNNAKYTILTEPDSLRELRSALYTLLYKSA